MEFAKRKRRAALLGYDDLLAELADALDDERGPARTRMRQRWSVVLVGVGNLGQALAGYGGFDDRGFHVAALVDADPARVGTVVAGRTVLPLEALPEVTSPPTTWTSRA